MSETTIHNLATIGDIKQIQKWLSNNSKNINAFDSMGCTPLYYAAENGHLNCVKLFIEKGALIDATGHNQCTPLMAACQYGHLECAKYLISKGANVNKSDHDQISILNLATRTGHFDCVKLLVENGADVNYSMAVNHNILSEAKKHPHIVKYLIENGADINKPELILKAPPMKSDSRYPFTAYYGGMYKMSKQQKQLFLDTYNKEREFRDSVLNNKSYPIWKQTSESKSISRFQILLILILGYFLFF